MHKGSSRPEIKHINWTKVPLVCVFGPTRQTSSSSARHHKFRFTQFSAVMFHRLICQRAGQSQLGSCSPPPKQTAVILTRRPNRTDLQCSEGSSGTGENLQLPLRRPRFLQHKRLMVTFQCVAGRSRNCQGPVAHSHKRNNSLLSFSNTRDKKKLSNV